MEKQLNLASEAQKALTVVVGPGLGVGLVRRETPTEVVGVLAGAVDLDQHRLLVCGEEGAPVVEVPLAVHVYV